jgi:predicted dehydrogenase
MIDDNTALRVGIVGTSWWADSMYLPAFAAHPGVDVVGLCGRNAATAEALAATWDVPWACTDSDKFLDPERLDAVVIATGTDTHEALTMTALDRDLHVLCEKPLAPDVAAADRMTQRAAETGAITLVPFTYRYMPTNQFVKRLIDTGYVGTPFHLNMRYFAGYARDHDYNWRFDRELAGSGALGDLGSHWLHIARWLLGEITHIGCVSDSFYPRGPRPDGTPYEQNEDSALMTVRFANGAHGSLQVCAASWEGTDFNQTHHLDLHGTDGTLYAVNDWSNRQEVSGVRANQPGPAQILDIPDDIWNGARRDNVHNTYRDVFRAGGAMVGDWVDAVRAGKHIEPDLAEGAIVQHLIDLATQSAAGDGRLLDARR